MLPDVDSDPVAARLLLIRPYLDERAWRLLLGAEAEVLGWGGIKLVAAAGGCIRIPWRRGVRPGAIRPRCRGR